MIEQGLSSPSVNSLARILSGIPMSLGYFFTCDLSLLTRSVYSADELTGQQQVIAQGVYQQIIPLQTSQPLRYLRFCYKPGADSGEQLLRLPQALSGYLVQGELELTINAEVNRLGVGDAFALAALQAHRLRNISPVQDCIFLVCLAG
jgi:quercetin dioxygenase-like cupin family protein